MNNDGNSKQKKNSRIYGKELDETVTLFESDLLIETL